MTISLHDLHEQIENIIKQYEAIGKDPGEVMVLGAIQPSYPLAVEVTHVYAPLSTTGTKSLGDINCASCGKAIESGSRVYFDWDEDAEEEVQVCQECVDIKDQQGNSVVWMVTSYAPSYFSSYAPRSVFESE